MTGSPMNQNARIYVAGHRGMVGSAILRHLQSLGYTNLITRTHAELDLLDQAAVRGFLREVGIDCIVMAAAKVGGIYANNTYRADFIYENLMVEANVVHEAQRAGIDRLLFLGSSCIYPQLAPQPMREEHLLTGPLEPTNEPYAIAKIAGIKLCESYNRQYGTKYRSLMPTNLYGPADTYHLENSHLMAALIRKCHLAKRAQEGDWDAIRRDESHYGPIPDDVKKALGLDPMTNQPIADSLPPKVALWGTGTPRREFLHVDDMAAACVFVMGLPDDQYEAGLTYRPPPSSDPRPPSSESASSDNQSQTTDDPVSFYNVGTGKDHTIRELAEIVARVIGYTGRIDFDTGKPDGMPQKLLDTTRISRLGWTPKIPLADGIKQTYEDYRSHMRQSSR